MISAAMAPVAAVSVARLHSGCLAAIHSSRSAVGGGKLLFPRAGLCYTSSWTSWIHQHRLECSLLLSRARYRSNRRYRGVVSSSLFGVGAPEILVIGVVALLVFGPKGLAEVARSLGQSLRAFQPTIRELQDVSREFKQTLEKEIGLDELKGVNQRPVEPTTKAPPVNENFVMEEITAQLDLMQQEKAREKEASAAAQETKQQEEDSTPEAITASTSAGEDGDDSAPVPVSSDIPAKEKETAVNNVAKD